MPASRNAPPSLQTNSLGHCLTSARYLLSTPDLLRAGTVVVRRVRRGAPTAHESNIYSPARRTTPDHPGVLAEIIIPPASISPLDRRLLLILTPHHPHLPTLHATRVTQDATAAPHASSGTVITPWYFAGTTFDRESTVLRVFSDRRLSHSIHSGSTSPPAGKVVADNHIKSQSFFNLASAAQVEESHLVHLLLQSSRATPSFHQKV